jgi:type I restriction enzyme S subunit
MINNQNHFRHCEHDTESNIPKLRFPEFKDDWTEVKLGKIATFFSGGTPTSSNKRYYGGNIPFIGSGKISANSVDQYITEEALKNSSSKLIKKGDLLYALYGATSGEVAISKLDGAINQAVLCIRSQEKTYFLLQWLLLNKESILNTYLQGGQGNLSAQIIKSLMLNLPKIPEQEKIANFFTAIDTKIDQLTKKQTLLKQYKKGVMQKLFSQELRFKADDGSEFSDWEEKKISQIFEITRGNVLAVPKMSQEKNDDFQYPVYSSQTKNDGLTGYYNEYLFEDCITWTTDGANAGDANLRRGKFYCTNVCGVLKSDKGYANQFVAEALNSVTKKYVSYVGNPKLMNNTMGGIKITIPSSIEEQTKIASFLTAIDTKINLSTKQLDASKQFKKALLQQMFV